MKQSTQGFSLVELMVAMSIMAIGLVGTVAMQATAKQNGVDSSQRSIAVSLAQDLLSRMRLNKSQLSLYESSDYGNTEFSISKSCLFNSEDDLVCTPEELAFYDRYQWNNLLSGQSGNAKVSGLIRPSGCVDYDESTGAVAVVISWLGRKQVSAEESDDNQSSTSSTTSDLTTLAQLQKNCGVSYLTGKLNRRRQVAVQAYVY